MAHFPPVYSDDESKILIAIYENPDVSYDTYALTQLLTGITAASPDFEAAFKKTLKAIEQLLIKKFDEKLAPLATKQDVAASETRVIKRVDNAQEDLAGIVADTIAAPFSKRFDRLEELLEVKEDVLPLKRQMLEIRTALHLSA